MPDPYARALERADEDEQAHDLAEHLYDRGLVPRIIYKPSPAAHPSGVEGWGRLAAESAVGHGDAARNGADAPRFTGPAASHLRASRASVASRGSGPSAAGERPSPPYLREPGVCGAGLA